MPTLRPVRRLCTVSRTPTRSSEEVEVAFEHAVDPAGAVAAPGIAGERSRLEPVSADDCGRHGRLLEGASRELGQRTAFALRPRLPRCDLHDGRNAFRVVLPVAALPIELHHV